MEVNSTRCQKLPQHWRQISLLSCESET